MTGSVTPMGIPAAGDLGHLLTLNLTEGVGGMLYRRLLRHFGSLAEAVAAPERALREVTGVGPVLAKAIRDRARDGGAAREIDAAARLGIRILPFWDEAYPAALKPLYDPPLILYMKGALVPEDAIAVAIVGTRSPTYYGRSQAERFARLLAARGVTVVSGLARGVDTVAHDAALKAGGRTVAVIGSGLRNVYPPENAPLAARVAEHGALLSEFCLQASPNPKNFPRRNRILSGLSLGVLVVEAGAKSGALITTDWALEQGREVFAVPGKVDSPQSAGCNALLKQGAAKLVESVEDILVEIPGFAVKAAAAEAARGTGAEPPGTDPGRDRDRAVLACLSTEPRHIDAVIAESGLPSAAVASTLLALELKRLIRQLPGKHFVRR
jgi:DNA processing protein